MFGEVVTHGMPIETAEETLYVYVEGSQSYSEPMSVTLLNAEEFKKKEKEELRQERFLQGVGQIRGEDYSDDEIDEIEREIRTLDYLDRLSSRYKDEFYELTEAVRQRCRRCNEQDESIDEMISRRVAELGDDETGENGLTTEEKEALNDPEFLKALSNPMAAFNWFETRLEGENKYFLGSEGALAIDLIRHLLAREGELSPDEKIYLTEYIIHEALERTSAIKGNAVEKHRKIIVLTTKLLRPEIITGQPELWAEMRENVTTDVHGVYGRTPIGGEFRGFIDANLERDVQVVEAAERAPSELAHLYRLQVGIYVKDGTKREAVADQVREILGTDKVDIVPFVEDESRDGLLNRMNERGDFGLIIDTDDITKVKPALESVLNEVEYDAAMTGQPVLTVGREREMRRGILAELKSDGSLSRRIIPEDTQDTVSNIELTGLDVRAFSRFAPLAGYRLSPGARGLSTDDEDQRLVVIPSPLLENDPALRDRLVNKKIQMGFLEGKVDPLKDVLVVTDERVTTEMIDDAKGKERVVDRYLKALRVRELIDDNDVILREHLDQACRELREQGDEYANYTYKNLTGAMLERVVRYIMAKRGVRVTSSERVGVVGLERHEKLADLAGLVNAMLTGVSGEAEKRYYEDVIEQLVADGDIPGPVAEEIRRRKEQLFDATNEGFEQYEKDLLEERQRMREAAEAAKSA